MIKRLLGLIVVTLGIMTACGANTDTTTDEAIDAVEITVEDVAAPATTPEIEVESETVLDLSNWEERDVLKEMYKQYQSDKYIKLLSDMPYIISNKAELEVVEQVLAKAASGDEAGVRAVLESDEWTISMTDGIEGVVRTSEYDDGETKVTIVCSKDSTEITWIGSDKKTRSLKVTESKVKYSDDTVEPTKAPSSDKKKDSATKATPAPTQALPQVVDNGDYSYWEHKDEEQPYDTGSGGGTPSDPPSNPQPNPSEETPEKPEDNGPTIEESSGSDGGDIEWGDTQI